MICTDVRMPGLLSFLSLFVCSWLFCCFAFHHPSRNRGSDRWHLKMGDHDGHHELHWFDCPPSWIYHLPSLSESPGCCCYHRLMCAIKHINPVMAAAVFSCLCVFVWVENSFCGGDRATKCCCGNQKSFSLLLEQKRSSYEVQLNTLLNFTT